MSSKKVLSSLAYFSIILFPFLFPFILWLLSKNELAVHHHAARAMRWQAFPLLLLINLLLLIPLVVTVIINATPTELESLRQVGIVILILTLIFALIYLGFVIYNIYWGIKMLTLK